MQFITHLFAFVASALLLTGAVAAQLTLSDQEAEQLAGWVKPGSVLYGLELAFEDNPATALDAMQVAQERLAEYQIAQIQNNQEDEQRALADHWKKVEQIKDSLDVLPVEQASEVQRGLLNARMILQGLIQKTDNTGLKDALDHININIQKVEEKRQQKITALPKERQGIEDAKVDAGQLQASGVRNNENRGIVNGRN